MRSLNTSIASILPVLSLLAIGWGLLGAVALEEFALALFIGMVSGVYSSIFVATPLLASMHRDSERDGAPTSGSPASRCGPRWSARVRPAATRAACTSMVGAEEVSTATRSESIESVDQPRLDDRSARGRLRRERLLSHPPRPRKKKRH